jgi:hypothetical protein
MVICKKPEMHVMKITGFTLVWILLFGALVTQSGILSASAIETVPLSPTNLSASAISNSQISLTWNSPINATGITGYQIEYKTGSASYSILSITGNQTTYLHTGLVPNTTYTYRVSAINSAGIGNPSNEYSATTSSAPIQTHIPSSPVILGVTTVSNTSLKITWTTPSDNGGTPITDYLIQRNGTTIVTNTSSNQTTYTDTNLLPIHQQTYQIAAWNSVGLGGFSNSASGITGSNLVNMTKHFGKNLHGNNFFGNMTRHFGKNQNGNNYSGNVTRHFGINSNGNNYFGNNVKHFTKNQNGSNFSGNTTKHFGKNQNGNTFFGNVTKHSEKKLPIFQKIINHFEKKLGKQNNQTMHYQGNGPQGNRHQNFSR